MPTRPRSRTLNGKAHRSGLYQCNECREQFTVTVGSVMERSKIPLNKWLMAMHLMGAGKKGTSALQMSRMLEITYQSAWFLCHRIREAMTYEDRIKTGGPLGGPGKVVEADETVVGGKAKNRAYRDPAPKKMGRRRLLSAEGACAQSTSPILTLKTSVRSL